MTLNICCLVTEAGSTVHIRSKTLLPIIVPIALLVAAAYLQWAIVGLPSVPPSVAVGRDLGKGIRGFPAWLCITHYINFLLLILLVRSGLQILMDHPRLYWNVHCTPRSEWIRFTPIEVPLDRVYTAKDDSRYLSPILGLPGGRHTLGLSRHWHFAGALFWVLNGATFIVLLFATGQWRRLVPTSWRIVFEAWAIFVHYATFHMPAEPNGFYHYNALQQLTYFGVVFILAPLQIIASGAMSPALVNRFKWYPKLPGNRQVGRSIHFLFACAFVIFLVAHVAMVALSGFVRNMNHIVLGKDGPQRIGMYLGFVGIAVVVLVNVFANWASLKRSRLVQHTCEALLNPIISLLLDRSAPATEYTKKDISSFFWVNGKMPTSDEWKTLASHGFKDYRLTITGLVENPLELSLADLQAMDKRTQVTLHNCIQGWSGIAAWGGVSMTKLMERVRPKPNAKWVVFYSFSEGGEGGEFYDSHSIANMWHPQALLAYEMNYAPLAHLHGAPVRLRVENELGFKMVKWVRAIEFVENVKGIHKGEGGYNEDNEFFGSMADI